MMNGNEHWSVDLLASQASDPCALGGLGTARTSVVEIDPGVEHGWDLLALLPKRRVGHSVMDAGGEMGGGAIGIGEVHHGSVLGGLGHSGGREGSDGQGDRGQVLEHHEGQWNEWKRVESQKILQDRWEIEKQRGQRWGRFPPFIYS